MNLCCLFKHDLYKFFNLGDEFLMESERFRILKHELDGLSIAQRTVVPGHPTVQIPAGRLIGKIILH